MYSNLKFSIKGGNELPKRFHGLVKRNEGFQAIPAFICSNRGVFHLKTESQERVKLDKRALQFKKEAESQKTKT